MEEISSAVRTLTRGDTKTLEYGHVESRGVRATIEYTQSNEINGLFLVFPPPTSFFLVNDRPVLAPPDFVLLVLQELLAGFAGSRKAERGVTERDA